MTQEELDKLNDLFTDCKYFKDFFDKNENKIKIGDFVRINLTSDLSDNTYAESQVLCLVNYSFREGVSFNVIGLYKEKEKEKLPDYIKAESEYEINQWPYITNYHDYDFCSKTGVRVKGHHGIWPEKSNVRIVDFMEELDKIELSYVLSCSIINVILNKTGMSKDAVPEDSWSFIKDNMNSFTANDIALYYIN